jgi:hypothetical protein
MNLWFSSQYYENNYYNKVTEEVSAPRTMNFLCKFTLVEKSAKKITILNDNIPARLHVAIQLLTQDPALKVRSKHTKENQPVKYIALE